MTKSSININTILQEFDSYILTSKKDSRIGSLEQYDDYYSSLLKYLSLKGSNRKHYRHYATRTRVEQIISQSAIYLSDGSLWNDKFDRENFNSSSSRYKNFGVCLSANSDESIAMWMLYGGIDGNGAMIDFDKNTLQKAMNSEQYEAGFFDSHGKFVSTTTLNAPEVLFRLMDVIYFSRNKNDKDTITIERIGEPQVKISSFLSSGLHQISKHKSWSYESEVRLVATVNKQLLQNKAEDIQVIRVPLDLDDVIRNRRIYNSPISNNQKRFRKSMLFGTVDWNLCGKCSLKDIS